MNLVPVKCSTCGANVEVDQYTKSFTCSFCGATTIIEKNPYSSSYHDESLEKAELLINNQQNYLEAKNKYSYMTSSYPDDPRVWIGLIRCYTRDLKEPLYIDISPYEPIWLSGFENRVMNAYHQYLNVETKEQEKENTAKYFIEYINNNKKAYEELLAKNKVEVPESTTTEEVSNFDETIKCENKIIKSEDLKDIINLMYDTYNKYMLISTKEIEKNKNFDFDEKEFTFKDNGSSLKYRIDFHDNTNAQIDNTEEFLHLYETRLHEIKSFDVMFHLNYDVATPKPNKMSDYRSQYICIYIRENSMNIDIKLNSTDDKISNIYRKIKEVVLTAPPKYDDIVKNRMGISLLTSFGYGLIPSIAICTLLCLSETLRTVFVSSVVLYPILCLFIGLILGELIQMVILKPLYEPIKPEQKYEGYKDGQSVYSDDVDSYTNKSEILIGKNVNNLTYREKITSIYNKAKTFILIDLIVMGIISIIIVFVGNL